MADCGPYICPFPKPEVYRTGELWVCPRCLTTYRMGRPKRERWWRNWYAPDGHWQLVRLRPEREHKRYWLSDPNAPGHPWGPFFSPEERDRQAAFLKQVAEWNRHALEKLREREPLLHQHGDHVGRLFGQPFTEHSHDGGDEAHTHSGNPYLNPPPDL